MIARDNRPLPPIVLVVDDDPTTSLTLRTLLGGAGFRTACATDRAQAWTAIRETRPDLMLLDVHLPDGSGFELCQQLQREPGFGQMPVLFISANDELSAKIRGFEVGGVDYISKPLAGTEVLARVGTHLRLRQAYEALEELQAERLERLASAQKQTMPQPSDLPAAKFTVALKQKLSAGGDFYDVLPSGENSIDYLVADASGHDLGASYWTAALKALVSEYANPLNPPAEVLRALNGALKRIMPPGSFFTVVYARLNRKSRRLSLVSAGHPPAVVTRGKTGEVEVMQQTGDVLGAFDDAVFGATELTLLPGDRLFLYSDGLVEGQGAAADGVRRLAEGCRQGIKVPLAELVPALANGHGAEPATDDIVLMGVDA